MRTDRKLGRKSEEKLNILSFNIEGIRSNAPYLHEILDKFNIICLQEHWLWDFEKNDISKLLPKFNYFIRSVDSDFPRTHYVRSRGYGGILIAWKT